MERRYMIFGAALMALAGIGAALAATTEPDAARPRFEVDPFWPTLPDNWILGEVAGIDVDHTDRIWIVQRPGTLEESERGAVADPRRSLCCTPAPPVMELTADGTFVQGWGGPQAAPSLDGVNQWPSVEHGIYVDDQRNVWIAGNGDDDHAVLKFTAEGDFLMQIGRQGRTGGDRDTALLGRPAEMWVDAGELFVADGYRNHRVVVFDADSGAFKRMWGADGRPPGDPAVARPFGNPVHCVAGAADGLIYVCDRINNRVQVFRSGQAAGVDLVREIAFAPGTLGNGAAFDVAFSPEQTWLYVADGENQRVWIFERLTGEPSGWFGRGGHYAGQFTWLHNLDTDSHGNIYTAEVFHGKRAQKFTFTGVR